MANVPYPTEDELEVDAATMLQQIAGERDNVFNVYRMLSHSPVALRGVYELASGLWNKSTVPADIQELCILRIAQLNRCGYEWARHRPLARRAGLSDDQIDRLREWREAQPPFSEHQRMALRLVECMLTGADDIPDALHDLSDETSTQAVVELVVLISFYAMMSDFLNTLGVDVEPGSDVMYGGHYAEADTASGRRTDHVLGGADHPGRR
jgi:AhpD family alkylhydroperoxidase